MNAQIISIVPLDDGTFDVRRDGRCTGPLTWDEMLGHVASMTIPTNRLGGLFRMASADEWRRTEEARARTFAEPAAKLGNEVNKR